MNRLIIASAVAAAAAAVSVPAFAGLANNPSFSHGVPVKVPSHARLVQFDHKGGLVTARHASDDPTSTKLPAPPKSHESEAGDDNGGATEPGDDNGGATELGDDNGAATEPGDDNGDRGGHGGSSSEPGDDHDGSSGHGG